MSRERIQSGMSSIDIGLSLVHRLDHRSLWNRRLGGYCPRRPILRERRLGGSYKLDVINGKGYPASTAARNASARMRRRSEGSLLIKPWSSPASVSSWIAPD